MPQQPDNSSSSPSSQPGRNQTVTVSTILQRVTLSNHQKRWAKKYRTEIAASSSSLLSTYLTYPLDSVKSRMQTYYFTSAYDCFRSTYRSEGVYGFWRGCLSPMASITLVRTFSFSVYQKAKYSLDAWIHRVTGKSPLVIANTRGATPNLSTMTCFGLAGVTAGAAVTFVACPFELTKLSQQLAVLLRDQESSKGQNTKLRESYSDKGTYASAKLIVQQRGFRGLYSGVWLHLGDVVRDSVGTGIYFMSYESVKQLMANARGNSPTSPAAVVFAGGFCGIVSWACIYPLDTAKAMYQRNCLSSKKEVTELVKVEYLKRRMYYGLGVSVTRSALMNAIFFSCFEVCKQSINGLELD